MGFEAVLIAFITGGFALSVAYVRAEYLGWRERGAAERRREAALRQLHAASLSEQREALLLPSVLKLQGFEESEAANPDLGSQFTTARRAAALRDSRRPYPPERRKRAREPAAH